MLELRSKSSHLGRPDLRQPNFEFLNGPVFHMLFFLTKDLLFELRQWIADGNDIAIEDTLAEAHEADLAELLNKNLP